MTRKSRPPSSSARGRRRAARPGRWPLQDAKAQLSELVRRAQAEGPQHVTVHGRDAAVLVSIDEFRRLKGVHTGAALVAALRSSPYREVDLAPARARSPVRAVKL